MNLQEYFRQLYEYHFWANRRYFEVARGISPVQLRQPQGQSWGDIYGILLHMYSAEWMWMQRWNGLSPAAFPQAEEFPDLGILARRWLEQEEEIRSYLRLQTSESLERVVQYRNTRGLTFELTLWQILAHVVNHATHHRGELAAIFSATGISHPEEEVNQYFISAEKPLH